MLWTFANEKFADLFEYRKTDNVECRRENAVDESIFYKVATFRPGKSLNIYLKQSYVQSVHISFKEL